MTVQWRGWDYSIERSGNGIAATITHGGLGMIVRLSHVDQQYVLLEALEDFIAKCDKQKQWRAIDAARDLYEQVDKKTKTAKTE